MRRLLPALLLCPLWTLSQEVQPVVSPAYLQLIRQDITRRIHDDSAASKGLRPVALPLSQPYYSYYQVGNIVTNKNGVYLKPYKSRVIKLGGVYSSTAAIKTANRMPALQRDYAQGRALNGSLQWRGPETGELYSYGPAIAQLEYDNTAYPYDMNGRLVPAGTGNGRKANAYDNKILRTGSLFEQAFTLRTRYLVNGRDKITGNFRVRRNVENLIVSNNRNTRDELAATVAGYLGKVALTGNYLASHDRFPTNNRTGFLNRAYQQSLLTPVSFDNNQGYLLAGGQRSYSADADNPWFLLKESGNDYQHFHHTGGIAIEKNTGALRFKVMQSAGLTRQQSEEQYKPGTAFFPAGQLVQRTKRDESYSMTAELSYFHRANEVEMEPKIRYMLNTKESAIDYLGGSSYRYQRTANDLVAGYQVTIYGSRIDLGGGVQNKMYISNTSTDRAYWLPAANAFVSFKDLLLLDDLDVKLTGSYNRFNSELPIDRSLGHITMLNLPAAASLRFFPTTEVESFDQLKPVRHEEWTAGVEATFNNLLRLKAGFFSRTTVDDVFPFFSGNRLLLQNAADHRNRGLELTLSLFPRYWSDNKLSVQSDLSLVAYRNKVLGLSNGLSQLAIAGFSDVQKVLVPGQPVGAIAGSRYLRDAGNNIIIGDDGFPLVDNTPAIIGNPVPDFVMKFTNTVRWLGFTLTTDLEWKKGGEVWNGTQAVLDYYGRSAQSASLRTTTGYVFPGVLIDGHVNTRPVAWYDPALPLQDNRWVRYGYTGVAEAYIQRGDYLRITNINLSHRFRRKGKFPQFAVGISAHNLLLWTPYQGGDPAQLLFDQDQTEGLDYFNLPSVKTMSLHVSLQF